MTLIKGAPSKQDTNRYARVVQHVKGSVQREKAHGERQLIVWPSAASVECVHCKAPFALSLCPLATENRPHCTPQQLAFCKLFMHFANIYIFVYTTHQ